jgi:rubrerythrin
MTITKGEILSSAKQLEVDGRAFYLKIAAKTKNQLTRKMFISLADDELKHIEWIEKQSVGGITAKKSNQELSQRLKAVFADLPKSVIKDIEASDDDIKAVDIALEMERKSRDAYAEWAKKSSDKDIQSLFKALTGIEQFHYDLLQNTKEYFLKTSDWFMMEEGWMFDGG